MRKYALIVLLLSLCLSGAAFAQNATPVYCGTLSDADCAILTNSQAAMHTLDSAAFDLTVNATVSNVPNMKEPLTFSLVGNGSYLGASSLQSSMLAMMSAQSLQNTADFYVNLLDNLDADITLTLALPPELMQQASATIPSNITLQARLVDGIGYINLDPLQPLINQPNLKGWGGLDLASLLSEALRRQPDLFSDMEAFTMNSMDMSATMQQFTDPQFLDQFLSITRTDDGSGSTATFHVTVDFAALMSSPAMHDMMMQQMQMQGQTMTEAQIQQAMAMSAQMMQGMTLSLDEEIGLSDGFVHSIHGTFAFDTSGMMSAMNSGTSKKQSASSAQGAPSINVDFTITFRDFNSAAAITAPTEVMILPYQLLLSNLPTPTPTTVFVPTRVPTATGTVEVTAEPTSEVTVEPTSEVTAAPTSEVTAAPTDEATVAPSAEPTDEATVAPPAEPTSEVTATS